MNRYFLRYPDSQSLNLRNWLNTNQDRHGRHPTVSRGLPAAQRPLRLPHRLRAPPLLRKTQGWVNGQIYNFDDSMSWSANLLCIDSWDSFIELADLGLAFFYLGLADTFWFSLYFDQSCLLLTRPEQMWPGLPNGTSPDCKWPGYFKATLSLHSSIL